VAKVGRPKIELDYTLIESLAKIQCSVDEIASIVGCSRTKLMRDGLFQEIYKRGIDHGKMSLRRMQFEKAASGNPALLIWLGKQYLGQRETPADVTDDMLGKVTAAIAKAVAE
jgi:hypothetical protein